MYKLNKFLFILLVLFSCMCLIQTCFAIANTNYVWSQQNLSVKASGEVESDVKNKSQEDNFLNLESESAILVEQKTGKVLYSHNIHEQLHPASVTKIMSILLIMDQLEAGKLSLSDQISCSEKAASMGGSQIWLDTTETLSVDDMLKAICVRKCKRLCLCHG